MTWFRYPIAVLSLQALALCAGLSSAHAEPAHFVVTGETINTELQPFTATIDAIGNGHRLTGRGGGFEPQVFRTMLQATKDSDTQIIAPAHILSNWDSWQSGALDGADVEVLRIENGVFRSIRRDRVAQGGHQSKGWRALTPGNKLVPASHTAFEFAWDRQNRPAVPYYFSVRAVSALGRSSPFSAATSVTAPAAFPRAKPKVENTLVGAEIKAREGWLSAPRNLTATLTAQGTVQLSWSAVPGAVGYTVHRADTPPSEHRDPHLQLEGQGPDVKAGDLVLLRKSFNKIDRRDVLTHRVWSTKVSGLRNGLLPWPDTTRAEWSLSPHDPDSPVSDPGKTYVQITLDENESIALGPYNHAGLKQDWYPVLKPGQRYQFDVWLRGGPSGQVNFELTGFYSKGRNRISPVPLPVTQTWQRHSGTFEVPQVHTGHQAGQMLLRLTGPGVFALDNFRIHRADTPFLAFPEEDMTRLRASAMGALRTHGFIKTGQGTYDLEELTNPAGASNIKGGNTLPQTLAEMARVDMDPWLQIEPHFSREEWLGLVEYLAASFDPATDAVETLPWAAKRAAQGHAPWSDQFDRVYFEIGNETWNRLFRPWVFPDMKDAATGVGYTPGAVYGLYQEYVLSILRDSPHWPALEAKLIPVIGGWARTSYGFEAAERSPNTPYVAYAGYNGGWDEQAGPATPDPAGFATILSNTARTTFPRANRHRAEADRIVQNRSTPLSVGIYEAGPGYVMNGLNNQRVTKEEAAAQERAMKSVAAGTATLDAFLARAERGQVLQNFFTYGSGQRWTSHARWNKGGQTYPSWDLLSLFNREALGDMLAVETRSVPVTHLPATRRHDAVEAAPLIAAYATRTEDRLALIVVSRQVPGVTIPPDQRNPVTVDLPITAAERLTLFTQTGTLESQNAEAPQSQIGSEPIPLPETLPRLQIPHLPPGEVMVYVFEGVR